MRPIVVIIIVLIVCASTILGCRHRANDGIMALFRKTKVLIPREKMVHVVCSQYAFDCDHEACVTIVNVIDQYGCSGCRMSELARAEVLYEQMFESGSVRSMYIISAASERIEDVTSLLKKYHLRNTIYLDTCNAFLKANPHIPDNTLFHTFVLNDCDSVVMVGDPFKNEKMEALFLKVLDREKQRKKAV